MMERTGRCSGTPTTHAPCPRLGRVAPTHGRRLRLGRLTQRAVVRSYPDARPASPPASPMA